MNWQDFHFLRPWWLLMLFPAVYAVIRLWRGQGGESAWRKVVSPELLPHLLMEEQGRLARWPLVLAGLGFFLAILAVAGPAWERLPQPVFSNTSSLVIAMDLSSSMNARDLRPSRLQQARFKVEDILKQRREGQTALVAFAGAAFTVSPLTDDARTIIAQLPALTPDIMPVQGSNTAAAIDLGVKLLEQAGHSRGSILLVTDGVNTAASVEAAQKAARLGYRVSVLAVGTEQGAPIPTRQGILKDARGNIVVARLDTAALKEVAEAGQGVFVRLALDASDIAALHLSDQAENVHGASRMADKEIVRWKDMGPWLLLVVLPLAALAFRRGVMMLAFIVILPWPHGATADWWTDLWQRPDQQGQELLLDGKQAEQAAQVFRNPDWKASAFYRAGRYPEAEKLWKKQDNAESLYNLGNALAREGRLKDAVAAYDAALKKNPDLEDARANRDLVKKLLEQQNQQNQQNQQAAGSKPDSDKSSEEKAEARARAEAVRKAEEQKAEKARREAEREVQENPEQQEPQSAEAMQASRSSEEKPMDEEALSREQWLKRIPDDPGGLLRRKFRYYYQRKQYDVPKQQPW
jgi:Ca-activated chloride channel family protein